MNHTTYTLATVALLLLFIPGVLAQEGFRIQAPDNVFLSGEQTLQIKLINDSSEPFSIDVSLIAPDAFSYRFENVPAVLQPTSLSVMRLIMTPPLGRLDETQIVTLVTVVNGQPFLTPIKLTMRRPVEPPPEPPENGEEERPPAPLDFGGLQNAFTSTGLFFAGAAEDNGLLLNIGLSIIVLILLVFLVRKFLDW